MVELAPTTTVAGAALSANSSDRNVAFTGTVQIRKMLSSPSVVEPPIDEVIKSGVVPRLIQFLSLSDDPNFQCEALWALANICSGSTEQTEEVIKCGIGPQVIALLSSSPNVNVCEQAAWALGNICGDGIARRDYMIQLGFFPALLKAMIRFPNQMTFLRNATWALSNGCRGKPTPDVSYFQPSPGESVSFMPTLEALLQCNDVDVITDAIWALSYLSDSLPCVKLIISTGRIIPTLVQILSVNNHNLQIPALRALGDVATQSSEEAQVLIDAGIFQAVTPFLIGSKKDLKKESCWVLSNLASGTMEQVATLCKSGVVPHVVKCLSSGDMVIRREACWVICNCIETNNPEIIQYMISLGIVAPFAELLEHDCYNAAEAKLLVAMLTALQTILATDTETPNKIWATNSCLLDAVSALWAHNSSHPLVSIATKLLEQYAPDELRSDEDDEDEDEGAEEETDKEQKKKDEDDKEKEKKTNGSIIRTTSGAESMDME
ncbi:Importin subunit alpha-4 [Pelomyxa schiedti]|nr:Importin subunit alpha-4 [Pelomyxa schiedti]